MTNLKKFRFLFLILYILFLIIPALCAGDFSYDSKGKRDPFIPLVGPGAVYSVKDTVDIKSIEDVSLEGIVYDGVTGDSIAIINGMIMREREQAGMLTVEKIESKKVILSISGEIYEVPVVGEGKEGGMR